MELHKPWPDLLKRPGEFLPNLNQLQVDVELLKQTNRLRKHQGHSWKLSIQTKKTTRTGQATTTQFSELSSNMFNRKAQMHMFESRTLCCSLRSAMGAMLRTMNTSVWFHAKQNIGESFRPVSMKRETEHALHIFSFTPSVEFFQHQRCASYMIVMRGSLDTVNFVNITDPDKFSWFWEVRPVAVKKSSPDLFSNQ